MLLFFSYLCYVYKVIKKTEQERTTMKNKIMAAILTSAMLISMTACGDAANNSQTEEADQTQAPAENDNNTPEDSGTETPKSSYVSESRKFDLHGSDYVTELCDYSKIPVTITGDYEVTQEKAEAYLNQLIASYGSFYVPDESKTKVGEGDIVNVDYAGKVDGVAFENGSAEDQVIDVDNNRSVGQFGGGFIPGFTDALKNAKKGDVIDGTVTFPEDYNNTDLAGKEAVFTFTVNAIMRPMTAADADDAFAKEQFNVDTVEEMYQVLIDYLKGTAQMAKQSDITGAIQDYMMENCKYEIPEDYVEARLKDYRYNFILTNCQGDESKLESFLMTNYNGTSVDEAEEIWRKSIQEEVGMGFILDVVAERENIAFDEEKYNEYLESMVSGGAYESVDKLYETYGYGDPEYGKMYTKKIYLENLALNKIKETAVITEKENALQESEQQDGKQQDHTEQE